MSEIANISKTAFPPRMAGCFGSRQLADGRWLDLAAMLFTTLLSLSEDGERGRWSYMNAWCFEDRSIAVREFLFWEPSITAEPNGWTRQPTTGRRRPDGDPLRKYTGAR
jgi:hypothetical protein